jgi:ubiquinone/menaquinone biosynthesis C-methylase UbiE
VDGVIRLDLGSGHHKFPGWISVDIADERKALKYGEIQHDSIEIKPDVVADSMHLPFADNYADEARAIHVIEHFQPWDAEPLLREWLRVLKPGGQLALECPCFEKIIALASVPHIPPAMTYWGIFGDPRYKDPLMMHHWCYGQTQLIKVMAQAGFVNLRPEIPQFHQLIRDMRIVGEKPREESRLVRPE